MSNPNSLKDQSLPPDGKFDLNAEPIWILASRLSAQVPNSERKKLPTDLARNFDAYQQQTNQ